jgi:hypothetical protein
LRFSDYDPDSFSFFLDAIGRTIKDRQTDQEERETLIKVAEELANAEVQSGRKQGRSIIYSFEASPEARRNACTIQLIPGPNHSRRFCAVDCSTDSVPVAIELAP